MVSVGWASYDDHDDDDHDDNDDYEENDSFDPLVSTQTVGGQCRLNLL